MDRFRVKALEKAIHLPLTSHQDMLVKREIVKKCRILVQGFKKRNKISEAQKYSLILDKYKPKE
jgi:hypothetical protein